MVMIMIIRVMMMIIMFGVMLQSLREEWERLR